MIVVPDSAGVPVSALSTPKQYAKHLESILLPSGIIQDRIQRMAEEIFQEMSGGSLTLLCVLKGSVRFTLDLLRYLEHLNSTKDAPILIELEFLRLQSYHNDSSTGEIEITGESVLPSLKGRRVLVVEDIIDTGGSLHYLLKRLQEVQPATLKVASLLVKRTGIDSGVRADFVGFEIPNKFVVGYGLDYNEVFRDMPHIGVINETGKTEFAK